MIAYHVRIAVIVALIIAAAIAMPARAAAQELPPSGDFPDRPCGPLNSSDFYHAPDGWIYECVCEKLPSGEHVCDWYEQGWAEPLAARKHPRRHIIKAKAKHPRIVAHPRPAVVA